MSRAPRPAFLGGLQGPFLRALDASGRDRQAFRRGHLGWWALLGVLWLAVLALLPIDMPVLAPWTLRVDNLSALLFLAAAVGLWLGMGGRAFVVAAVVAAALYGLAASVALGFTIYDVESVALLVSFLVFALAGFNLVFVVEEVVHDLHQALQPRGPVVDAGLVVLAAGLTLFLPWFSRSGPMLFGVLWATSVGALVVLAGFWALRSTGRARGGPTLLRQLHVFVVGALAAALMVDLISALKGVNSLVPSLVAYGSLIGTWVYVSYTTLQRTHFLLPGNDPRPWLALLGGASFAILGHAQALYETEGSAAVGSLFVERASFLAWGAWLGLALYLLRGAWQGLLWARGPVAGTGATLATGAAGVAAGLLATEDKVERAAYTLFRRLDQVIPGPHHPPNRPRMAWERDLGIDPDARAIDSDVVEVEVPEGAD
ncbi:MAG: hypothetical protein ACYDBQ_06700 [Thermoplasmatota archaeon]